MTNQAMIGGFQNAPHQSAQAFRSLMNAIARPGTIEDLAGASAPTPMSDAAAALLLALVDKDTPVHLAGSWDNAANREWIIFHTGAPIVGPEHASFAVGDWEGLQPISRFPLPFQVAQYQARGYINTNLCCYCCILRQSRDLCRSQCRRAEIGILSLAFHKGPTNITNGINGSLKFYRSCLFRNHPSNFGPSKFSS